jgi:hypothetical protein
MSLYREDCADAANLGSEQTPRSSERPGSGGVRPHGGNGRRSGGGRYVAMCALELED